MLTGRARRYAALEGRGALAMKATLVAQGARSQYRLTEARVGGALTRHDLNIQQARPLWSPVSEALTPIFGTVPMHVLPAQSDLSRWKRIVMMM